MTSPVQYYSSLAQKVKLGRSTILAKLFWQSYDGVLYGVPSEPPMAGASVQVCERQGLLTVWFGGQQIVTLHKHARSGEIVPHPDQFRTVPSAASARRPPAPQGHLVPAPQVAQRALEDYDQLCGVSGTLGRPTQEVPA